jgi:hypothetical protein
MLRKFVDATVDPARCSRLGYNTNTARLTADDDNDPRSHDKTCGFC